MPLLSIRTAHEDHHHGQANGVVGAQLVGLAGVVGCLVVMTRADPVTGQDAGRGGQPPQRHEGERQHLYRDLAGGQLDRACGAHEDREHQEPAHVDEAFPGCGQADPYHVGDGRGVEPARLVDGVLFT